MGVARGTCPLKKKRKRKVKSSSFSFLLGRLLFCLFVFPRLLPSLMSSISSVLRTLPLLLLLLLLFSLYRSCYSTCVLRRVFLFCILDNRLKKECSPDSTLRRLSLALTRLATPCTSPLLEKCQKCTVRPAAPSMPPRKAPSTFSTTCAASATHCNAQHHPRSWPRTRTRNP